MGGVYAPFWDPDNSEGYTEAFDLGDGSPWDVAFVNGDLIPGKTSITDGDSTRKIDVQNGPGVEGATMKFQSIDPSNLTIVVTLWTAKQWAAWQKFSEIFQPKPGKKPPGVIQFYHPATAAIGVTQIVSESVSTPKDGGTKGTKEVTIKARQYLKPKPAKVLPAVVIKAPGGTVAPTENDKAPGAAGAGKSTK
jgi:hypothetical protein